MQDEKTIFTLPKDLFDQLRALADTLDMSIEEISIQALELFVQKHKNYNIQDDKYKQGEENL